MTPGARLQAAIELLAAIHRGTSPADRAAAAFFRGRRYIGGTDRREILERTYAVLRARARLDWWIVREMGGEPADSDRARMIAALAILDGWTPDRIAGGFDGGQYRPAPLERDEKRLAQALKGKKLEDPAQPDWLRLEIPEWLAEPLRALYGDRFEAELRALMAPAETDLRVNTLKGDRAAAIAALAEAKIEAAPTKLSPLGLRIAGRPPLAETAAFKDGLVEVQDEGSQIVALLTDARPGQRVVDFCAGAGGKTLALAAAMQNKGHVVACDTLEGRIERAGTRLRRAGVHNVERRGLSTERDSWVKRHAGGFDRVLIDAPCSGSGTWRRNPDQKWRLSRTDVEELAALQGRILDSAQRLVKPGGRLVYATCALLEAENERQVERFVETHPQFRPLLIEQVWRETIDAPPPNGGIKSNLAPDGGIETNPSSGKGSYLRLTPAQHGTDGFFVAVLERMVGP